MNAYIPITQVVDSYLNERGEYSVDNYRRYLQIILEGYRTLEIQNPTQLKTVVLEINDANVAQLPADYIDYARIGVVRNGRIYTLSKNNDLYLKDKVLCGTQSLIEGADSVPDVSNYLWYTVGGGFNVGQYRIDNIKNSVYFGGDLSTYTVVMEYVSDGISGDDTTYVPKTMLPLLKSYLDYIISLREKKDPLGRTQMLMQLYYNEVNVFSQLTSGVTIDEVMDAIRSGYSQGAKR